MSLSTIQRGVSVYRQWKTRLAQAVDELDAWLAHDASVTPETATRIRRIREQIRGDRLTLAVVAADHSDAVPLVNALFSASRERPLLPIGATLRLGCPITFSWDERRNTSYLRLLPKEANAEDPALAASGNDHVRGKEHPLTGASAEEQGASLLEILDLQTSDQVVDSEPGATGPRHAAAIATTAQPTPPALRRVLVSLAHPLLQQGLTIALVPAPDGRDHDVTHGAEILARAQAIVLVLPAEGTDMPADVAGRQHWASTLAAGRAQETLVVTDVDGAAERTVHSARSTAATSAGSWQTLSATLGLAPEQVFPVAIQRALRAGLDGDQARLRSSALPGLDRTLATLLLQAKQRDVVAALEGQIGALIKERRSRIAAEITRSQTQLQDLEALHAKSQQASGRLVEQTRRQREEYLRAVLRFQEEREQLLTATQRCRELLARENIDRLVVQAHQRMVRSWTTRGLGLAMKDLFDRLRQRMQGVADESERLRKLVRSMYSEFREDYNFALSLPKVFVPTRYHVELELLYQEVETFRHSRGMVLTEQAGVIERLHEQMVSRARVLFDQLSMSLDPWIRDSLQPIADAIHEHQATMEQRLTSLERLERSSQGLEERIEAQRASRIELIRRLTALRNIQNTLFQLPLAQDPFAPPRLVAELG